MSEKVNYYSIIPANVRYNNELMPNAKLLYGEITALCNKEGVCWATNEYFANLYSVSERTITDWVKKLEQFGYISTELQTKRYEDGTVKKIRLIHIELLRQNHIELFPQNHIEEKFAYNNTSNINITRKEDNISNDILSKKDFENDFEILWKMYPRKQGKTNALKSFIKARKKGVSIETITLGLQRFCDYVKNKNIDIQYIPYGSTWFNGECWNDEYKIEPIEDNRREFHLL